LQYKLPNETKLHDFREKPKLEYKPLLQQEKFYGFACAVIHFGSLLRDSKFTKENSWNDVVELAQAYADPKIASQNEFIALVQQAKSLYGKKRKKKEQ
jgi:Ca-activated chloride channel family protein